MSDVLTSLRSVLGANEESSLVASLTVKGALSSAATTCSQYVKFSQGLDQLRNNHFEATLFNWVRKSTFNLSTEHLQQLICMLSLVANATKQAHSTTCDHNST